MTVISFSLPDEQIGALESLSSYYGFVSRSELVRSILRFVLKNPIVLEKSAAYPFTAPDTNSAKTILADFKKTRKYSPGFLTDLRGALKQSNYFQS